MQKSGIDCVRTNVRNYLSQLKWGHIMRTSAFMLLGILIATNLLIAGPLKRSKMQCDKKVTVEANNITFSKLFEAIELQANVVIMYENTGDLANQKVTISAIEMRLGDLLDKVLSGKSLKWHSRNNKIRIDNASDTTATLDVDLKSTSILTLPLPHHRRCPWT